jgi:hypothetical protein
MEFVLSDTLEGPGAPALIVRGLSAAPLDTMTHFFVSCMWKACELKKRLGGHRGGGGGARGV